MYVILDKKRKRRAPRKEIRVRTKGSVFVTKIDNIVDSVPMGADICIIRRNDKSYLYEVIIYDDTDIPTLADNLNAVAYVM